MNHPSPMGYSRSSFIRNFMGSAIAVAVLLVSMSASAGQPQTNIVERRSGSPAATAQKNLFDLAADFRNPDSLKKLKELLAGGADPNQLNEGGELLLNHAIRNSGHSSTNPASDIRESRYDNVLAILEAGADVKKTGNSGTPLHLAANLGDVNLVYLLLEKGADINARDSQGRTPLQAAIPFGIEAFNILLHKGADLETVDNNHQSITDLIIYFRNIRFFKLFLQHGGKAENAIMRLKDDLTRYPGRDKEKMLAAIEAFLKLSQRPAAPPPAQKQLLPSKDDPPLVAATRANRVGEVKKLLEGGADPNAVGAGFQHGVNDFKEAITHGATALHISLFKGFDDISRLLIEKGANVNLRASPNDFDDNNVPLMLAVKSEPMTRFLLDHGAKVDLPSIRFENTALMTAAKEDVMKLLLEKGADINHVAKYGNVLKDAVDKKDSAKVAFLLKQGAKVNLVCEHDGSTALHAAVSAGDAAIVKMLLENGADPEIKNDAGFNPYDQALSEKKTAIADLFKKGAKPKSDQKLLVADAVRRGNHELLKRLLDEGEDPNGDPKWPYLIQAIYSGGEPNKEIIKLLIGHGASVTGTDTNKRSLLHFIGDSELIDLLVSKGANVNATDDQGETPLHKAAEIGDIQRVKQLLKLGAKAAVSANDGQTPLHLAACGPRDHRPSDGPPPDWSKIPDYLETIRVLVKAGCSTKDKDRYGQTPFDKASQRREADMGPLLDLLIKLP